MFSKKILNSIEPLEARIAPASLVATAKFVAATTGSPIVLHAGEVLTTGGFVDIAGVGRVGAGTYLLYVEQGDAIVYTVDRNNNSVVDFNEITGISAGDGLRLTSFVDIYGDIVTNLNPNLTLTDSDANSANGRDGRVVLNNTVEKITLRSLTAADVLDENGDGDTTLELSTRLALSSYSIHGNIYAGKGFGLIKAGVPDLNSGLIIDDTGRALQDAVFNTNLGLDFYSEGRTPLKPTIGFIRTGSAVSGEWFSFGVSKDKDVSGYLSSFQSPAGQHGADIVGINPLKTPFNIAGLVAGDGGAGAGGVGAPGGNIVNATFNGDVAGGYILKAGDGGRGPTGGVGGSVINFQDVSSVTGKIVIKSGTGGGGTTGAAGDGGVITFGLLNVNGGLEVQLGNGGDGFTSGGAGASLSKGIITTPEGAVPFGTNVIGTTHQGSVVPPIDPITGKTNANPYTLNTNSYGVIGRHYGIDFNHDGFGDAVIAGSDPNTLSVVFGDGTGLFPSVGDPSNPFPFKDNANGVTFRLELDAPINPEAIVVADFNQDGFLDIAVASNAPGSFGGISVFLSKTEDTNDDGILTDAEDTNHNKRSHPEPEFLGFRTARQSFLPSLAAGDPDIPALAGSYAYVRSAVPIVSLAAGDFDGDGFTDLAVMATYIVKGGGLPSHEVLMFLQPNIENGRPTGEFYANVGTKAQGDGTPAFPIVPFRDLGGTFGSVQATALTSNDTHDFVAAGVVGGRMVQVFDTPNNQIAVAKIPRLPVLRTSAVLGNVDIDRQLGGNHVNLVNGVTLRDFAIVDSGGEQFVDTNRNGIFDLGETYIDTNQNGEFNPQHDGVADISIITENPAGFVLNYLSSGVGNFFNVSVNNHGKDNAGTWIGGNGFGYGDTQAIRDVDANGDGFYDEVAVLSYLGAPSPYYAVVQLNIVNSPPLDIVANPGATVAGAFLSAFRSGPDPTIVAFDSFIPDLHTLDTQKVVQYLTALPHTNPGGAHVVEVVGDNILFLSTVELSSRYINLNAGNGGGGLVGSGGNGGLIGGGKVNDVSVTLPANAAYQGVVDIFGGKGGDGFSNGGTGGLISGVVVRGVGGGSFVAELFGGDGGYGVGGNGGKGGSLSANSIERGLLFQAGDGGRGRLGGAGGDILGNGVGGAFYDTFDLYQYLVAGTGGAGIKGGGTGGNISDFHGDFSGLSSGSVLGQLSYIAGDGGSAISGPGGDGGYIVRSTPYLVEAHLAGDILLQGGKGGDGRSGGAGGGISTFAFKPSDTDNPSLISVLAGDGGHGVSGLGGVGGSIANVNVPTVGKPNPGTGPFFPTTDPIALGALTPYTFDRILGGNGGGSSGSVGGAGGSVFNIVTSNADGAFVVSAGSGGNGLLRGGQGGSVMNSNLSTGGETFAKSLIVAGAGGNAFAFIPNRSDEDIVTHQAEKAFGGLIGRGGNGGSIVGFQQNGATKARLDLIAGDGGNTINYGTAADRGVPVGIGGTVQGIKVAGSIGNTESNVPIKAYNDVFKHQSVANFLDDGLRDPRSLLSPFDPLYRPPGDFADATGVVGLVVGAAGRLKESQVGYADGIPLFRSVPAFAGTNGSAIDIAAGGIMSMVAGSVDRVASIQVVSGIQLTREGILGTDKGRVGVSEYLDKDGLNIVSEPFLDGKLIDGALIYKSFVPFFTGDRLPNNPRIFKLG